MIVLGADTHTRSHTVAAVAPRPASCWASRASRSACADSARCCDGREPLVVFICRDQSNAKEFCRAADPVVTAALAYGGEYAAEWPHPARERMLFVAEGDAHERTVVGYALPSLPPDVRVEQTDGDPRH